MLAQIETAEEASSVGEGVFVRVEDGELIPDDLRKESYKEFEEFDNEVCENPTRLKSIGKAFDDEFNNWIKTKVSALKNRSGAKTRAIKW